jgi:AAA family ATP:ADP antiporter
MSQTAAGGAPRPGLLDRTLRVFSDVRPGEAGTVVLLTLNLFVLLVAYYVLKTVREPLVLVTGGAEIKAYASAGQALTLMLFVPAYGWLASRVDRLRLIVSFVLFFTVCIEVFFLGGRMRVPNLGFVFYIWVGIFSLATIAQFWSFANDLYTREAGDRLFAIIVIGQTGGAWVGSKVAEELFEARVDPFTIMHVSAALMVLHLVLYVVISRRESGRKGAAPPPAPLAKGPNGFSLVLRSPYLRLIGLLLIVANLVNTMGEYLLDKLLVAAAPAALAADPTLTAEAFIGSFKGSYFFWVNFLAVLLQAFVASRIVKYLGIRGVVLALPVVALGTYGLAAVGVGLVLMRWAKTAENATDYSIMNTAKAMLWLPTSREEKYKAKQTVDTFFVRTGDMISAGLVYLGTTVLALDVAGFARTNLVIIVLWIGVAFMLLREHRKLVGHGAAAPTPPPS